MSNRDSFQRQTGLLQSQKGTAPLRPSTRTMLDPATLRATTEEMVTKTRTSLENLEPRIELLLRASQNAGLPVPGVYVETFKFPPSPKGEQICAYLQAVFSAREDMAREVQVAVFRFYEAGRLIGVAEASLTENLLAQATLEELKLQLFYLGRYHEVFKADRVLAQLFPPPQTVAGPGTPGAKPISTVERLKQKQQREGILHKAEILLASMAPKMETVELTLQMIDEPKGLNIQSLFTPNTRTARLLSLGVASNPTLIVQLREAHRLFKQLADQLAEAKAGGDVEPLKETIFPLSQLSLTCRAHPLLKDVFPAGDGAMFPDS